MNLLIKRLTQPFGLRFNPSFFFSISKPHLIEKHEAILASKIMQKIIQKPVTKEKVKATEQTGNKTSHLSSLRKEVIEIIKDYSIPYEDKKQPNENSQQNQIKDSLQAAKKNMLKYFDGGVLVDGNLCIQDRFYSEEKQNQNTKEKKARNGSQSTDNAQNMKKLTFCPTYLVTGEVFRTVLLPNKFLLIKGHFGIGKTYSFLLYHLLSDVIYKYLHKYCKQNDSIPQGININFPKLVYWSIDIEQMGQENGPEIINKIIADQCYELTEIYPNYQFFKTGNMQNLRIFYQSKKIRTRLIIDQINVIASALRDRKNCNLLQRQLKNQQYREVELEAKKDPSKKWLLDKLDQQNQVFIQTYLKSSWQIKEIFRLAQQLRRMVGILTNKFGRGFFLSSRDIEESLLKKLNLNGCHNHSKIFHKNLKYESLSQTQQNLTDLSQFFVFLLKIKFKQLNLNSQDLTEEQNEIFSQIKQIAMESFETKILFLLPVTMQWVMFQSSASALQQIINIIFQQKAQSTQLKKNVDQIIQIINDQSIQYLSQIVNNFLNKSECGKFQEASKEKSLLLLMLYYEVKKIDEGIQESQRIENGNIIIDAKKIFDTQNIKQKMEITKKLSKNLGYYDEGGKFVFSVNQKILLKILSAKETSLLENLFKLNADVESLIQGQVFKGFYIETLLRKCVSIPDTQLILKMQKNIEPITFSKTANTMKQQFFFSIPRSNNSNYNQFYFLKSFQKLLKQADQRKSLFCMPAAGDAAIKKKKYDETSKNIDFVLAQKTDETITISAFDVTINMKGVQKKISDFFYEFSNFEDKEQQRIKLSNQNSFNVNLKYFILVPKLFPDAIQWKKNIIGKAIQKLNDNLEIIQKKVQEFTEEIKKLNDEINSTKKSNSAETIKQLNDNIKQLVDQIIYSQKKIERISKRIQFLQNLSLDSNLKQNQSSLEIFRSDKVKTLLTKVAVVSFFDAQFKNSDQGKIASYKNSLEKMKDKL